MAGSSAAGEDVSMASAVQRSSGTGSGGDMSIAMEQGVQPAGSFDQWKNDTDLKIAGLVTRQAQLMEGQAQLMEGQAQLMEGLATVQQAVMKLQASQQQG
ncbi:hypothetical protein GPECTOR_76g802 [Gonium pectorale]|uniref:Uncharacterized protein n=1 Tax=Gonium pectorale TaxID=33097 RepID=A0A150G3W3_GONPE|nr:hypothetical protein GPECTOR_76g802 [Gonium pectorale]|eukprot:KXZ43980.1 hypothetical protein GPECTOR_76g802 [Gonium pectorale]